MRSMTGFGKASGKDEKTGIGFRIGISSINRKQFEVKFALPHEISFYECALRRTIGEKISRGSLTVRVDFPDDAANASASAVNLEAAKKAADSLHKMAEECRIKQPVSMADILAVPGVLQAELPDYAGEDAEKLLCAIAAKATDELIKSRESEGVQLEKDIRMRTQLLSDTLDKIVPLTADMPRKQYDRLLAKLKEWDLPVDHDDERLLREMVLFADKLDVTEEVTRLRSHFMHFNAMLSEQGEAMGRQLDFMVQEIFREINTLGNKAACAEVSPLVVTMKTELEKIREQIQNIE